MVECIPSDTSFLSQYQENARQQIIWDSPEHASIRGLQPEAYMFKGLQEELGEVYGPDRNEGGYKRLGALAMSPENKLLLPGETTDSAVERHLKEFGDVSWYLANYLGLFGISFERSVPVGLLARRLDAASQTRSSEAGHAMIESALPWVFMLSSSSELLDAAKSLLRSVNGQLVRLPRDERIQTEQKLLIASGKFVVSMIHLLCTRFSTTYEQVLTGNQEKLAIRIEEGTIFDKTGGDDR